MEKQRRRRQRAQEADISSSTVRSAARGRPAASRRARTTRDWKDPPSADVGKALSATGLAAAAHHARDTLSPAAGQGEERNAGRAEELEESNAELVAELAGVRWSTLR